MKDQAKFHHQKNCQCNCNCNMFDESQFACVNRAWLKEVNNTHSVEALHRKYDTCGFHPFARDRTFDLTDPLRGEERSRLNKQWAAATLIQKRLRG